MEGSATSERWRVEWRVQATVEASGERATPPGWAERVKVAVGLAVSGAGARAGLVWAERAVERRRAARSGRRARESETIMLDRVSVCPAHGVGFVAV